MPVGFMLSGIKTWNTVCVRGFHLGSLLFWAVCSCAMNPVLGWSSILSDWAGWKRESHALSSGSHDLLSQCEASELISDSLASSHSPNCLAHLWLRCCHLTSRQPPVYQDLPQHDKNAFFSPPSLSLPSPNKAGCLYLGTMFTTDQVFVTNWSHSRHHCVCVISTSSSRAQQVVLPSICLIIIVASQNVCCGKHFTRCVIWKKSLD